MLKLAPKKGEKYFNRVVTRPSPRLPEGMDMAILEVGHLRSPKGVIYPRTRSDFCILGWCVQGEVRHEGEGWTVNIQAGQAGVVAPDLIFITTAPAGGCEYYYLLMDGPRIPAFLDETQLWTGVFPFSETPIDWLEVIADYLEVPERMAFLATTARGLFYDVSREAEEQAPDPMVWRAESFLQQHWGDGETNVEAVLEHLGVSRSMLSGRFKVATGKTILEYLADVRYHHAIRLLRAGELPVNMVARRCGFATPSHFTAWFHKRHGQTPRTVQQRAIPVPKEPSHA